MDENFNIGLDDLIESLRKLSDEITELEMLLSGLASDSKATPPRRKVRGG